MKHFRKVRWREELYDLYDSWGINKEDIALYGDPWQIAKAHTIVPEISWIGGEGNCESTLDIELVMGSQSGLLPYSAAYKLGPFGETGELEIADPEKYPKHFCKYEGFEKGIGRLPGPCKHRIAGRLFLESNLEQISGLKMRKLYKEHKDPNLFWVRERYDERTMGIFNHLLQNRDIDSIEKRDCFYGYLRYGPR